MAFFRRRDHTVPAIILQARRSCLPDAGFPAARGGSGTRRGRCRARRRRCGRGAGRRRRRVHPRRAGLAARSGRPGARRSGSGAGRRCSPVASPIRDRIDSAADLRIGGEKLHTALLRQFYAAHDFQPVWESRKPQAEALLRAVARAGEHGLDPELFHAGLLRKLASLSPIDRDLLLSDAFLGYADALARGAVPIEARYDDEDLTPEPIDVAAVLTRALDSPDPAAVIEGLAPRSPAYLALRRALQSYRADDAEAARAGVPLLPAAARRSGAPSSSIWNACAGSRVSFRPTASGSISRPRVSNCIATTARSSQPASSSARPTSRRRSCRRRSPACSSIRRGMCRGRS